MAWVRSRRPTLREEEPPSEPLESPADGLVKSLARRQADTRTTLGDQLRDNKLDGFERGAGIVRVDQMGAGATSLQAFEERRGLLEKEGETVEKMQDGAAAGTYSTCTVSRHEMELALSVKPGSVGTRLFQFAAGSAPPPYSHSRGPDPLPVLQELEQRLAADPVATARTVRRKRRQLVESAAAPIEVPNKPPEPGASLWDVVDKPASAVKKPRYVDKTYTCKGQTLYTIRDGKIVKVSDDKKEVALEKEELKGDPYVAMEGDGNTQSSIPDTTDRLTEEQIRQLPKFSSYRRGHPSKILYVKNLAKDVTETDLAALFVKFQEVNDQKIVFRLMTGKMRRQAFITFGNVTKATEALEQVNGIFFKGKPLIIAFGKQDNS